jgi:hypothetical protein
MKVGFYILYLPIVTQCKYYLVYDIFCHSIDYRKELSCICMISMIHYSFSNVFKSSQCIVAITRTPRHYRPTHYLLKIQSYSLLINTGVEKYESGVFEVGGHKWWALMHYSQHSLLY